MKNPITLEVLNQYYDFTPLLKYPGFMHLLEHGSFYPRYNEHFIILKEHRYTDFRAGEKELLAVIIHTKDRSSFNLHPWFEYPGQRLKVILGEEAMPCRAEYQMLENYFKCEMWASEIAPYLDDAQLFHSTFSSYCVAFKMPSGLDGNMLDAIRKEGPYHFYTRGDHDPYFVLNCKCLSSIDEVMRVKDEILVKMNEQLIKKNEV
jgi:hypothetical protein